MKNWTLELVAGPFGCTTEGPSWDGRYVYFTAIQKEKIMRYDPKTGDCIEWCSNTNFTNGTMFDAQGTLYGCCARGRSIVRFEPDGSMLTLADKFEGKRINTPNDLAIDRQGRIWFTNPWNWQLLPEGEVREMMDDPVMCLQAGADGKWTLRRVITDTSSPNGILLSKDECTLYVAQSDYAEDQLRELRAYPINDDGSLGRHTVLHQFSKDHRAVHRGIDGMCLDAEGNIVATAGWAKSGPGPLIYVFSPSGRILETHTVPVDHPTNCTFGDADLGSLYVTTGKGHLFRARTDRVGYNLYP